jgi:uncharacterized membrane protein
MPSQPAGSEPAGFEPAGFKPAWTDQQTEIIIGQLLRAGVLLSAFVVLSGGIIYLARHGRAPVGLGAFHNEPQNLKTIPGIAREIAAFRARGIIQLGLLLLIATPVARVAFSIYAFAKERDYMYLVFTLIVLAVLLYSLFASG